jgi:diguanylate cyclase (GGDEF)-like protein
MPIRNSVLHSIAARPWTSAQDALLGVSVMAVGVLLAIEYELFVRVGVMAAEQQRINLLEAILLTILLGLCIAAFIYRRMQEQRSDAAKHREVEQELAKLRDEALRDPLTGLANRRAIISALSQLAETRDDNRNALLLLDLNEFKRVNDEYGHVAGDRVLQVVAERFRRISRPTDLLARLGGDEFAILAYGLDREGATMVGNRFIATTRNEVAVGGVRHFIGVSIGAVIIPDDGVNGDELIAKADLAMYEAKAKGHSALAFFHDGMGDWRPSDVADSE